MFWCIPAHDWFDKQLFDFLFQLWISAIHSAIKIYFSYLISFEKKPFHKHQMFLFFSFVVLPKYTVTNMGLWGQYSQSLSKCSLTFVPNTLDINITSAVEFQRWWIVKSKIFGQESTYSKDFFFNLSMNYGSIKSAKIVLSKSFS